MSGIVSLIPYFGGSFHVAAKILEYVNAATKDFSLTRYGEVFGGGCRVLLNSPYFEDKYYNEIDLGLCRLVATVGNSEACEQMIGILKELPYSKEGFLYARDHRDSPTVDIIVSAAYAYITATQSRVGTMKGFKSYRNPAQQQDSIVQYYQHIDKIRICTPCLVGVHVTNGDFRTSLYEHISDEHALFVIDPPFLDSTRLVKKVYPNELKIEDHAELILLLLHAKFKAILCGYDTEEGNMLYNELRKYGWRRISLGLQKVSSSSQKVRPYHNYYIWINF